MVTFGGVGSVALTSTASSINVPYPSGILAGDALLLAAVNNIGDAWTTPSGWASVQSTTSGARMSVWSKTAAGGESGTLTVSSAGGAISCGCMLRYTGVAASPFGTSGKATGSSSTTSPAAATQSPGASDMTVRFYIAGIGSATTPTLTNPGGSWNTELNLVTNVASNNSGIVAADETAGTDNQTITCSRTASWMVVDVVVLNAPPALPPGKTVIAPPLAVIRAAFY